MRTFWASVALGALAIAPLQAEPGGGGQGKGGGGQGHGGAHGKSGGGGQDKGGGQGKGNRGGQGPQAGNGQGGAMRAQGPAQRQAKRPDQRKVERQIQRQVRTERQGAPGRARPDMRGNGKEKSAGGVRSAVEARGRAVHDDRRLDRPTVVVRDDRPGKPVRFARRSNDISLIDGCPPGLAKKHNGCMPPGLARQMQTQAVVTSVPWQQPAWYGSQWYGQPYRYYDGYMLRLGGDNRVLGYVPLLGGALAIGELWPDGYREVAVPDYYRSFYDLGPADSYRYYDDAIYGVDQGDDLITSVIALLTGDTFNVGETLPDGYDVYNVPYAYRDQYVDGPDAMYRYSDGYVYEVDPGTQLIQAAIQLLTA